MSLKSLLGMEDFLLSDEEIMQQIADARRKQQSELVFSEHNKRVVLKLSPLEIKGLNWF